MESKNEVKSETEKTETKLLEKFRNNISLPLQSAWDKLIAQINTKNVFKDFTHEELIDLMNIILERERYLELSYMGSRFGDMISAHCELSQLAQKPEKIDEDSALVKTLAPSFDNAISSFIIFNELTRRAMIQKVD